MGAYSYSIAEAYGTVSRVFLFDVMRYFGFADSFITMIRNLHHNTTALFVANGMLSDPRTHGHPTGQTVIVTTCPGGNTSNRTIAKYPDPKAAAPRLRLSLCR